MTRAMDVANFFIDLANNLDKNTENGCITNLKVNKLLYLVQGWSLALSGEPMFTDTIEAWPYGPVIPAVYHEFKKYGNKDIPDICGNYSIEIFSPEQLGILLDVAAQYATVSAWELVDITHAPDSPWAAVYEYKRNKPIPEPSLREYFSAQDKLRRFGVSDLTDEDFVGYRDETDGLLILPKEYDDYAE